MKDLQFILQKSTLFIPTNCPFLVVKRTKINWRVVEPQLAEHLLLIPEVCSSIPVIGNILYRTYSLMSIEKTIIEKRGRECPIFKKTIINEESVNIRSICQALGSGGNLFAEAFEVG